MCWLATLCVGEKYEQTSWNNRLKVHSLSFSCFSCTDLLIWRANRSAFTSLWQLTTGANGVGSTAKRKLHWCRSVHQGVSVHCDATFGCGHTFIWYDFVGVAPGASSILTGRRQCPQYEQAVVAEWVYYCHPGGLCSVCNILLYFSFIIFLFSGFCFQV